MEQTDVAARAAANGNGSISEAEARSLIEEKFPDDEAEGVAESRALEPVTAKALCAEPDPPASDELLGRLVRRGARTVIGGRTGEGKTTLTNRITRAVVSEEEFLGWTGGGGRALVIDAEQGTRSIKRQLRETGLGDRDDVEYLRVPDGLSLDTDQDEIAAIEAVLAAGNYALVVADPLYKLHRGDSNAEREAVDLMRRLDDWRSRFHFALILSVHLRKRPPQGAKLTLDEMFGSGAYTRGAEVVLGIERLRPGYSRLHFLKDRDGDLPTGEAWGLLFDREEGFRRDPEDGKPRETTADQVRELLEADPGMTMAQLLEGTGKAERTVRDALTTLGAVPSEGYPRRYELPQTNQDEMF